MTRHRRKRHPVTVMVLGAAVLLAADAAAWVLWAAWHAMPLLLAGGAGWLAWRWRHRRHVIPPLNKPVIPGRVVNEDAADLNKARDELARLRDENDQLRGDLADAQVAAHAAWDAAASVAPKPAPARTTARDRLLADRLGGVHDLFRSER